MRNKRGFTLIELLAVIVVLAIIALITVPQVLGFTGSSKQSAAKVSAAHYIEAVENKIMADDYNNVDTPNNVYMVNSFDVSVKGKKPIAGWVEIKNKKVVDYALLFDDYIVQYNHGDVETYAGSQEELPIKNGNGSYLLDMEKVSKQSGYLDLETGEPVDHSRRQRTSKYETITSISYNVIITNKYMLEIFEYDKNYNYLGYVSFISDGVYEPSKGTIYFKVGIRGASGSVEKQLSTGQWGSRFYNNIVEAKVYYGNPEGLND